MTLAQIKALFKTGAIPTQNDFESLIDKIPNNEGGGDKTVNVETPNKPFIQGIRTIVDRNEGYTYVALLGLYDEAMQGGFDSAYRYPSIVLRFQCESGSVPPDGTIVQYAFGQYDDFDWDVDVVDNTARLMLEGLSWKTINFSHDIIRKIVSTTSVYRETLIFETENIRTTTGDYSIPIKITQIIVPNASGQIAKSAIYKLSNLVFVADVCNDWLPIKDSTNLTTEVEDFISSYYTALS